MERSLSQHFDLIVIGSGPGGASLAHRLAPTGTTYTWVPREQNKLADRLANEAMDQQASFRRLS